MVSIVRNYLSGQCSNDCCRDLLYTTYCVLVNMYTILCGALCKQKRQRTPRKPSIHATFIYSVQKYIK